MIHLEKYPIDLKKGLAFYSLINYASIIKVNFQFEKTKTPDKKTFLLQSELIDENIDSFMLGFDKFRAFFRKLLKLDANYI